MKSQHLAAAAAILFAAAAQAATVTTTLTVSNAAISLSGTSISVVGPAVLTNIGSGTFNGSAPLTAIVNSGGTGTFTITISSGGTLTGTISVSVLLNPSGSSGSGGGSITIAGGTGPFAGATGSFSNVTGTGNFSTTSLSGSATFSGSGTITTSGSGGGGGTPVPNITAVLDAGSYTPGIAQGSYFVVKGTNLSASGYTPLSFPLPTSSSGVSINFASLTGGSTTPAYLAYLYNVSGVNQLAAVLPSTVAVGTYNVTVTSGGQTSAPFITQVVKSKPGLITADSTGNGLAVMQNYVSASQLDVNRFTVGSVGGFTISPARPGQTEIAYSVGMGPDPTHPDNQASPGYNFLANGVKVQAIVGGMAIDALYAGRVAGGNGYEQINFVLPANVPTGCTVSFQISVNGTLSNSTFMAIAPDATSNACVLPGYTTSQLQNFDQGGTVYAGAFSISQLSATAPSVGTIKIDSAGGGFHLYTGFELASIPPSLASPPQGCVVYPIPGPQGPGASGGGIALDAGALTLTGPSGSNLTNTAFTEAANIYSLNIGTEGLPVSVGVGGTVVGGTYTLNGAGGTDVKSFSAKVTLGSPLTVTGGLPSVVTRSAGLTLNWTGGNPSDLVEIFGSAGTTDKTGTVISGASFICFTTAGPGSYNVPASILTQLPAVSAAAIANQTQSGSLGVFSFGNPSAGNGLFSATLTAGGTINNATFLGLVGAGAQPAYQ